jgi:hypothetical protein
MDFCANYCIKTLKSLSLSDEEVAKLEALYEELIRHAAELELENMLLKKQR